MKRSFLVIVLMMVIIGSCRENYDPNVRSTEQSFLVVEANLNVAADSTIIRLTRSFKLDDSARLKVENGATVTVEGSDNTTRSLIPRGNGYYISTNLNLTVGTDYKLHIRTANGREYESDFVTARATPAIDSISWEAASDGLRIFANTHDPSGNSRYYRWDYDETWEIRSKYYSNFIYIPQADSVRERVMPAEEVFYCWKYDTSSSIYLANSTRLAEDIIYKSPLQFIPRGDERLSVRYSIHVRQYAMDREAYNFYELMKKNTEGIGDLFSSQPFELQGNIRCLTDPDEYVLGYVTASERQKKRIFITYSWVYPENCSALTISKALKDSIRIYFNNGGYIPYDYNTATGVYSYSEDDCVDCTYRGGNLRRPWFW